MTSFFEKLYFTKFWSFGEVYWLTSKSRKIPLFIRVLGKSVVNYNFGNKKGMVDKKTTGNALAKSFSRDVNCQLVNLGWAWRVR